MTTSAVDSKGSTLGPLDLAWHLVNFFAPAIGLAAIAAALAKLVWRSELHPVSWTRLFAVAAAACTGVLVGGLVVLGQDGRIATYVLMVLAAAIGLWSAGFGPLRR